jgi:hypothetical protein
MKKTLTLILSLFIAGAAFADAHSKAVELMKLMEIRKNIDASMGQIQQFSASMIDSQGLDPEAAAQAKKVAAKSTEVSMNAIKEMNWEGMFAEIYAEVFTEEEIQGMIDFYKSPVGQKMLAKQPELAAATMQKMQVEMAKVMPAIQQAAMEAVAEAQAEE